MSLALEVTGLRKEYKTFRLNDISFSLEEGYIMSFIGPNGSGKTTTIRAILNQITRDAGIIKLWGMDNTSYELELKNRIGVVLAGRRPLLRAFEHQKNEESHCAVLQELG